MNDYLRLEIYSLLHQIELELHYFILITIV